MVLGRHYGPLRQYGHTILASLVWHKLPKYGIHTRNIPENGGLIHCICTSDNGVNFLQGNEIGFQVSNQGSDSFQIQLEIHSCSVVDVVGHDAKGVLYRPCFGYFFWRLTGR